MGEIDYDKGDKKEKTDIRVDLPNRLRDYLFNPESKKDLVAKLQEDASLKRDLSKILFSEDTRINSSELFYKNFANLGDWEIAFLQLYLILFRYKTPVEVWYGISDFDKWTLKAEFESIKKENLKNYIYSIVVSDTSIKASSNTAKLIQVIDDTINSDNIIDTNNNWHIDKEELQKMKNSIMAKLGESKEIRKIDKVLEKIMQYNFDISHNFSYSIEFSPNNRVVYESLDEHLPITSDTNHSGELDKIVKLLKNEWYWKNPDSIIYKNSKEINQTRENLKKVVVDFFEKHREELWKYGITDIYDIDPASAAKLTSIITMYYLKYNYAQAMKPRYWDSMMQELSESEKSEYLKDQDKAIEIALLCEKFKSKFPQHKNTKLKDFIYYDIWWIWIAEYVKRYGIKNHFSKEEKEGMLENNRNVVDEIFKVTSKSYRRNWEEVDNLPVDRLLEWWKWVCRNYAKANEKLFEAIKSMQGDLSQLKNSTLIYFSDVKSEYSSNENYDIWLKDSKNRYTNHAWNLLISIDEEWVTHKTQLDTTFADATSGINIYWDVRTLDKTYERAFQDIIKNNIKSTELLNSLLKYIQILPHAQGNNENIDNISYGIANFILDKLHSWAIKYDELRSVLWEESKDSNFQIRYAISVDFINTKQFDKAVDILWTYREWKPRTIDIVKVILKNDPVEIERISKLDFLLWNKENKKDFIENSWWYWILSQASDKKLLKRYEEIMENIYDKQAKTQEIAKL